MKTRVRTLLILLVGVVLIAATTEMSWAELSGSPAGTLVELSVNGSAVVPTHQAVLLIGLIALLSLLVLPPLIRIFPAAAVIAAGAVAGWTSVDFLVSGFQPSAALLGAEATTRQNFGPPIISLLAAVAYIWGGFLILRFGRTWPGLSSRYQRRELRRDAWSEMDRGVDPTVDE